MRILFVYDSFLNTERIKLSSLNSNDMAYLFPLTSMPSITCTLAEKINNAACNIARVQAARIINSAADKLRDKYIKFIAELPGRIQHKGRNLKELFAIDKYTTLWWFSLIAEKNPLKSDSFGRLAQLDSIVNLIKREKIDKIIFGCISGKLKNALHEYSRKSHIKFEILMTKPIRSLKRHIRESQRLLYPKHIMILIYSIIRLLLRTQVIKRQIGPLIRSIPQNDNSLLFFTYYPNIDVSLAQRTVFKDRSYMQLQGTLENNGQAIMWGAMYAPCSNISFKKSLEYAKRFIKNGYIIFFLEEFNSFTTQIKALFTVIRIGFKFLMLKRDIYRAHDFGNYNIYPLFKDDWHLSFVGKKGYWGAIYYYLYKSMLKRLKAKKCVYLCEMQEWEKALISARNALGIETSLYAYQSGAVSRMLLNFFNHPCEVFDKERYSIPQPDKIVCSGRLPYLYIRESGWPEEKFSIVESLRYSYLKKYLNLQPPSNKQNIALLVLSISPEESSSILTAAYESLKNFENIEVWVKPHPFLNLTKVFDLAGISEENFPFYLKKGPIENLLTKARIVIIGESGVAIEALAFGCNVVIVNTPEWINMSQLRYVKAGMIRTANSPEELRQTVVNILDEEYRPMIYQTEAKKIINDFFCLNQETDIPKNFLKLLMNTGK